MHRSIYLLACSMSLSCILADDATDFPPMPPVQPLSAVDEAKTFQLPAGYHMELILSEPDITEPVCMAFDANGRLYVAEMSSYMRDIDGTDELVNTGRVSVHWSSKGDGKYDQHRIFADKLKLPRLMLPLADGVLIGETDTNDIYLYTDTNGDGVSDEKKPVYEGGPRGGNLEHQPSGMTWALDNWIYTAVNNYRLRWKDGQLIKEDIPGNGGQWGATQDDEGKFWVVNAGGEKGPLNFQNHILYGQSAARAQFEPGFEIVWPAMGLRDFQGGPPKSRDDGTLNHFTATCGGEIYRGDQLPAEMKGNLFFGEPVGRLVRRTTIEVNDGITILHNPYPQSEFLRSTDACFRPVDMKTAPDGTLFICDMYRGIIQEGNWTREGSYLRKVILQHSMDKIINRGRVWRLVHDTTQPVPAPKLLDATSAQLVETLAHPNGWHRDTAQKLLVLKQDQSVVPALATMAQKHENPITRIHALWTLEGLGALTAEQVRTALKDASPLVRKAGIRASESLKDESLVTDLTAMTKDSDPSVIIQALLTAKQMKWKDASKLINLTALTTTSKGVKEMASQMLNSQLSFPREFTNAQKDQMRRGQAIYQELCFTCHGLDGKGTALEGLAEGMTLAPPLAGSKTAVKSDFILRVLMHGLSGPVNGKTYQAQMIPMANNTDDWIADIASYVRHSFGNSGKFIEKADVAKLRKELATRTTPWTMEEFSTFGPQPLINRKAWKLTASHNPKGLASAIDGSVETRWDSRTPQVPGMWLQIELPKATDIAGLVLDTGKSRGDWPRGWKIELSQDGQTWDKPILEGQSATNVSEFMFPKTAKAKFIRITDTGSVRGLYWSIHELDVLEPADASKG
ncbi:MAG: discoidin domain-containing protein [Verrucomicrobiales bacterium]|nr:discoidin domain-containing protein [Verrucomicrobiales bacterium]MCP5557588.1 discoidin domain-containing protein [Verrucomicrobiaceae bacterium]